jgi:hypothetical protein
MPGVETTRPPIYDHIAQKGRRKTKSTNRPQVQN